MAINHTQSTHDSFTELCAVQPEEKVTFSRPVTFGLWYALQCMQHNLRASVTSSFKVIDFALSVLRELVHRAHRTPPYFFGRSIFGAREKKKSMTESTQNDLTFPADHLPTTPRAAEHRPFDRQPDVLLFRVKVVVINRALGSDRPQHQNSQLITK